uniref:AP complex mu/sigma subunit domain-containing protein n=1 Tax=Parascaris univalens TaxID=6257 RepID=A0A915B5S8_PARUN
MYQPRPPKCDVVVFELLSPLAKGQFRTLLAGLLVQQAHMKKKITRELVATILARKPKMCAFLEYKDLKIVYKRLQLRHPRHVLFQICELDVIFNFEKAYFILGGFLLAGEIQETSKKQVLKAIAAQDLIQEEEAPQGSFENHGFG